MTISRGQMNRQLYMGGGIMNAVPREQYGFGSIFKGVKKAVKGVTNVVKDVASSDIGKAALLYGATAGLGSIGSGLTGMARFAPSNFMGNVGRIGNFITGGSLMNDPTGLYAEGQVGKQNIFQKALGAVTGGGITGNLGKLAGLAGLTTFLTNQYGIPEEEVESVLSDPAEKEKYLRLYYTNLNPVTADTNAEQYQQEVDEFVRINSAMGGRMGYALGGNELPPDPTAPVNPFKPKPIGPVLPNKEMAEFDIGEYFELFEKANPGFKGKDRNSDEYRFYFEDYWRGIAKKKQEGRGLAALGGRMNYALGDTASQNAMQAASVEGLPVRQNPKGVKELDLRDNGGFIPPVGIKEKEDDIPAMLSNNEFVFTADAVRGMGDGDVNLGAQRMYDQMKMLEAGGTV